MILVLHCNIMENNWFTLNSDTFLWLKDSVGLVYNAENKRQFIFYVSDKIKKICLQLLEVDNLYTVGFSDELINDNEINQWINSLIAIQAGYLSLGIESDKRPVSLKPILKVQDDKKYYEEQHKLGFKGKILQNLHELTIYMNGSEYGSDEYFKQTIYPIRSKLVLDDLKVRSFIKNSRNFFLSNINLVGNPVSYLGFERLISDIIEFNIQCTIYIMLNDVRDNIQKLKKIEWSDNIRFNILIDVSFDILCLQDLPFQYTMTFLVFSESDFIQFSNLLDNFSKTHDFRFIPLYNKENLSFFESNVFVEKEEMDKIDLSKNEIFIRQAFNIEDFGKLTVLPDGNVYANVNMIPLGTIDDSSYSIVYKEFISGQSWFRLRDQVPCDNCIYQWLCPSPSNYEIVLDRLNLCHVRNKE